MTRNEEYLKTIMDALGGDSTKIPPYTINSEDDLKYIAAAFAERAANKGKFIVTLTPTSPDYSGTMDKTVAEINAAYEAGQEIWFNVRVAESVTLMSHVNEIYVYMDETYPSFQANVMVDSSTILKAFTGTTDDGTETSYGTMVYTPAS